MRSTVSASVLPPRRPGLPEQSGEGDREADRQQHDGEHEQHRLTRPAGRHGRDHAGDDRGHAGQKGDRADPDQAVAGPAGGAVPGAHGPTRPEVLCQAVTRRPARSG